MRILIVGDSITHGSVGDWTWRYRLWRNLTSQGIAVDFVGPHGGVLNSKADELWDASGYADPKFDTDHAARWGMGFVNQEYPIGELVSKYRADVVVSMLGTNDLAFFGQTPDQVAASASEFVAAARAANPGVSIVLSHVPNGWVGGAGGVNWWLDVIASDRDQPGARVLSASVDGAYDQNVDTYDPLHPSASGEVKLARSVATALAKMGVGSRPDAFPLVVNGPASIPRLSATVRWGLVQLNWSMPAGATGVNMWRRVGSGEWVPTRVQRSVPVPRRGKPVQWKVQAFKGHAVSPYYSNTVTVKPRAFGSLK